MGDPRGRPELREALAEYLARARGVRTSPESIVICAGVRHAVELLTRVFGGRPIAVEAYGLFIFRDAIAALGVPTVPIGLDEHGAVVSDLDGLDVPAVLLTPAHHNPQGMPLHPSRRTAVVEWAQRTGGYVLDDDYDGEFRYDRQPVGALQALCPDRVVYLGSTSKSLSQTLRLGWMVLPDDLVDPVIDAAGGRSSTSTPSTSSRWPTSSPAAVRPPHPPDAHALPPPPRRSRRGARRLRRRHQRAVRQASTCC